MKKFRPAVSIILLVLFIVSAFTGLFMFFAPHPPRVAPQAVEAVKDAVQSGHSAVFYIKKAHEYLSMGMALTALLHIVINWNSIKSYLLRQAK